MSSERWMVAHGLTDEQKQLAVNLALRGETLEDIAFQLGISVDSLLKIRLNDLLFDRILQRARLEGLEAKSDQLLTIPLTYADVNRAKVMSDNLKWILSKRIPKVYGDKIDLTISERIDLNAALQEAKTRSIRAVNPIDIKTSGTKTASSQNDQLIQGLADEIDPLS